MYEPSTKEEMALFYEDWEDCRRRSGSVFEDYIKRRRAMNVAWEVTICLQTVPFDEMLSQMYFKVSPEMKPIVNFYENLLIDGKLHNEEFRRNLHEKFLYIRDKIRAEHQEQLLVEFFNTLNQAAMKKGFRESITNRVFSAYSSLLQQSLTYFYDDLKEYGWGVKEDGTFLTVADPLPMLDWCHEELTEQSCLDALGKKKIDFEECFKSVQRRFAKYGIPVKDIDDIETLCHLSNNYGNVLCAMMYYMSEQTKDMLPQYAIGFSGYKTPKKWLNTEYYEERLLRRNFALPGCIKASCRYAGDIHAVYFREVIKDESVVMLYRMTIDIGKGEYSDLSGYYIPSEKFFYSYYEMANGASDLAPKIKNFILELYFLLTVRRTDEEKEMKQYSRPLIAEEYEDVEKEPRWPNQPIISFSLKDGEQKKSDKPRKAYRQGVYEYDNASIGCFVRKLPVGQTVSWEAQSNAEKYGYELEPGYTFVTPFERKQRHIKLLS